MLVFYKDDKNLHTRACFRIYDIDNDGILNILNLMHVYGNLNPTTKEEMLKKPDARRQEIKRRKQREKDNLPREQKDRKEDTDLLTREVKLLLEEYLRKNDFYNPQLIKKTDINYELFFKVIGGKSVIKDEIRRKFWLCNGPKDKPHPMEPSSICAPFNEEQK